MVKQTILIPVAKKGGNVTTREVTGTALRYRVGTQTYRFLIHDDLGEEYILTHIRTGRKVMSLNNALLMRRVNHGHFGGVTQSEVMALARETLDKIVTQYGADKVNAEIDKHETVND